MTQSIGIYKGGSGGLKNQHFPFLVKKKKLNFFLVQK